MKCIVPGCLGFGAIFGIPSDKSLREKWQNTLPFNITLRPNSDQAICVKHFLPRYITCYNPPKDGSGKELFHTYLGSTSRLVDNAVPTKFPMHLDLKRKQPLTKGPQNEGNVENVSVYSDKRKKKFVSVPPLISIPGKNSFSEIKDYGNPVPQNSPIVQLYDPNKKRIFVLKKVNSPPPNMKSSLGEIEDGDGALLSSINNSTTPQKTRIPSIKPRSLFERTNSGSKLETSMEDLSKRKNISNDNILKSPRVLVSNASKNIGQEVKWPAKDSSCTVSLKSSEISQLKTLPNVKIISATKPPHKTENQQRSPFKMDTSSPAKFVITPDIFLEAQGAYPVINETCDNTFSNINGINDNGISLTPDISSVTSTPTKTPRTLSSKRSQNNAELSGNQVLENVSNDITSSTKIGSAKKGIELKSSLQNRLKKKVCVIPVKEVLNRSLSKERVRELIAQQFGLRVPYSSKLFKVFSYNLKKFKNNYKKRMYYRERAKRVLRRQRKSPSDKLTKIPLTIPANQLEQSENRNSQESLEAEKSDLITQKNVFEDNLVIKNIYRKRRYGSLEKNPAKQRHKNLKNSLPERFRVNFLGEVRKEKGSSKCTAEIKNIYNIPTTITNTNDKSQLEVLCQTLIEALHRLQDCETEGSQLNLIISITKEDIPSGSLNGIDENLLKNPNKSQFSESFDADVSRENQFGCLESNTCLVSNLASDLGREETGVLKEKVINQELSLGNDSVIQLNESLSMDKFVSSEGNMEKGVIINSNCNSCSEPTAVHMAISHDHSYSPISSFVFKNPRYLVKFFENNAEGKKQYREKVLGKPPSKKLIQKYENEKLKLQKRIYKLSIKIKTKNYHISEKNKKIKYLSNIICQQKGVKRIRFPKTLDEKLKKPEDFVGNVTSLDGINSQKDSFYSNTEMNSSVVPNEHTYIGETETPLALADDISFTEESFEKRFSQLYQSLAEITTNDT